MRLLSQPQHWTCQLRLEFINKLSTFLQEAWLSIREYLSNPLQFPRTRSREFNIL